MRALVLFFVFVLLLLHFGCGNSQKSSSASLVIRHSETNDNNFSNLVGAYYGDLPCAGCEAISTVLCLEKDHSFKMTYTYEGKADNCFIKEGKWSIDKDELTLDGIDFRYKIEPNYLLQLDLFGQEIRGDLAHLYKLKKIK